MNLFNNQKGTTFAVAIFGVLVFAFAAFAAYRIINSDDLTSGHESNTSQSEPEKIQSKSDIKKIEKSLDDTEIDEAVNPAQLDEDINSLSN